MDGYTVIDELRSLIERVRSTKDSPSEDCGESIEEELEEQKLKALEEALLSVTEEILSSQDNGGINVEYQSERLIRRIPSLIIEVTIGDDGYWLATARTDRDNNEPEIWLDN